jgi:hypothetical protein
MISIKHIDLCMKQWVQKNIDLILPSPKQPMPMDPSLEHITAMASQPFQAFAGQDHKAHIDAHLNFIQLNMVRK